MEKYRSLVNQPNYTPDKQAMQTVGNQKINRAHEQLVELVCFI
jgi:hypothetical protein